MIKTPPSVSLRARTVLPFVRAVSSAVTWKGSLAAQALALAFALLWHLRHGAKFPAHDLTAHIAGNAVSTLFVTIAALAADEALRRRVHFWSAYLMAALASSIAAAVWQWCAQHWAVTELVEDGTPLAAAIANGFRVFTLGGLGILAYINRQSAERVLQGVRALELERLDVERRLIDARLAAAQSHVDPQAVLEQLAQIRGLYDIGRPTADEKLEGLIQELRENVLQRMETNRSREAAP
jgi:hypothetical protein